MTHTAAVHAADDSETQSTIFAPRNARDRLIVALDLPAPADAERLVEGLGDTVTYYKIGMQLAFAGGLDLIPRLRAADKRVFLDMKLLDIDNTVANGIASIVNLDVNMTTIHAYPSAMRAAVAGLGSGELCLLAVTVLTSMDDTDLTATGYAVGAKDLVANRCREARAAGMGGIVCSPHEAAMVRDLVGPDMMIVTPGVRPAGADIGDQKRAMTPSRAIAAGADYLVVGRPVTQAPDARATAEGILADIESALQGRI